MENSFLRENNKGEITVNSSPYAVEVYHNLGFIDTDIEQDSGGIRYIPMVYECPCKHRKCEHHKDCQSCRENHKDKKREPACEREKKRRRLWGRS